MPCCCLSHTERSSRTHATLAPAQTLAFIVSATLGIFLQVMDPKAAPALRAPLLKNFFFSNKKTVLRTSLRSITVTAREQDDAGAAAAVAW